MISSARGGAAGPGHPDWPWSQQLGWCRIPMLLLRIACILRGFRHFTWRWLQGGPGRRRRSSRLLFPSLDRPPASFASGEEPGPALSGAEHAASSPSSNAPLQPRMCCLVLSWPFQLLCLLPNASPRREQSICKMPWHYSLQVWPEACLSDLWHAQTKPGSCMKSALRDLWEDLMLFQTLCSS